MKISLLVLSLAFSVFAAIESEAEYVRSVNTPNGLNKCMGARMEKGHNAEYMACVRKYFPSCSGFKGRFAEINISQCVMHTDPVNVTQKDILRQQQQREWLASHPRK